MKAIKVDWTDQKSIRLFSRLSVEIYKNDPHWVPPFEGEIEGMLNHKSNSFYKHSEAVSLLVINDKREPLARVTVINNHRYNSFNQTTHVFFTHFECINDKNAALCLFDAAFSWARERQLTKIIGPKGFTPLDGLGLLVDGFEYLPALGMSYNPAYYVQLLESVGFSRLSDIVSGYVNRESSIAEKVLKAAEIVKRRTGLSVHRFSRRSELLRIVPQLCGLYNKAIEGTQGNYPITEQEAREMARRLLLFANPKLIKILFYECKPVGFLFAYPDISTAVQKHHGRLFPFFWMDYLRELKKTKIININGAGIVEQFRGKGGTAILFSEMYKSLLEGNYLHAELVQVGVENDPMQNELKNIGAIFHKIHRLYELDL